MVFAFLWGPLRGGVGRREQNSEKEKKEYRKEEWGRKP